MQRIIFPPSDLKPKYLYLRAAEGLLDKKSESLGEKEELNSFLPFIRMHFFTGS